MRKRGAHTSGAPMPQVWEAVGRMGAEEPLTPAAWSSTRNGGHRGGGRGDVARVGPVVEWRLIARELPGLLHELRVIFDELRAQVAGAKVRALEDGAVVADRGRGTDHEELAQGPARPSDRFGAIRAVDDELRHQRVVVRRDIRAGAEARVDAHARPGGSDPAGDPLGVRHELAQRVLGVDAHLDGVPGPRNVLLREAEGEAGSDSYLLFDEVDPGDGLGDGVLDLEPCIDLEKIEVAPAEHELDGAGV